MLTLFDGQSADGNGTAVNWTGGRGQFVGEGDFGSGTLVLQMTVNGSAFFTVDATNGMLTADGVFIFELGPCKIRANLAGSTSPDLNAVVHRYTA